MSQQLWLTGSPMPGEKPSKLELILSRLWIVSLIPIIIIVGLLQNWPIGGK